MTVEQRILEYPIPRDQSRIGGHRTASWRLLTLALIALDGAGLALAFGLAYLIRFWLRLPFLPVLPHRVTFYSQVIFWAIPVWLVLFGLFRLYDRRRLFTGFQEYTLVVNACTAGMMAVIAISFLDMTLVISRGWLLMVWVLSIVSVTSLRFGLRRLLRHLRTHGTLVTRAVIVGANEEARALAEQFLDDPGSGIQIVGFVDEQVHPGTAVHAETNSLGRLRDLETIIQDHGIEEVVIATTAMTRNDLLDLYRTIGHVGGIEIRLSSGLFEILTTGVTVQEISSVPLMTPQRVRITGIDAVLKSTLDYVVAFFGLVVLTPVMLLVALLVKLDSPGPAFHRRRVLGQSGRPFDAFKFRTMVVNADDVLAANPELREAFKSGYKLKVDPRVTRVGRFLRRTSLDELPQLLNVLRGEMSLVGPRMIAPDEAVRYGKWKLNLLTVRPGITGPWQVRGRSDISYEERIRLSMHYIRNYSIWLDLEILLRTIPAVLKARGAY